ncbi:TetR/AcrR family transcriptional regulator [Campylobacter sp. VTCC 70190]|uniref:TetR/AcrR family transcriptional regulator n=1 Tax=Campylobacter sp. VTCC 70190 TaxID=3392118 RepID=UPI00398EE113
MNLGKQPSKKVLARAEKIKAVAYELFSNKGYQETSLSDIIKLSGGSYSNIYESFKSKEGLFFEILNDIVKEHFHLISSKIHQVKDKKDLKDVLHSFGMSFLEIFNQPEAVAFGKVIYSQVYSKDKHLVNWLSDNQENFAHNILTQYFQTQKNSYLANNAKKLAVLFCTMLKEPHHNLNILAKTPLMTQQEQKQHLDFIIEIFLNGIKHQK